MPNVTLEQFRATVQTGIFGRDASILDGEIKLKKNNKGKTDLVKTNFGGDWRRDRNLDARTVLNCTTDAKNNFNARQALLKALETDFSNLAIKHNKKNPHSENQLSQDTKAYKDLMEWAKNILHISLDDKFSTDMEVPPLDRRTIKRILTVYDKVIEKAKTGASYDIENDKDNWSVIGKKEKTFDHLVLKQKQFNDMVKWALKVAIKSIQKDPNDDAHYDTQVQHYTEAAEVIKAWFGDVKFVKHATKKQQEQQDDNMKFFFKDMLKGTLDAQTIALHIKSLAMKQYPLTLKRPQEGDQTKLIPIYQENMSNKLNARKTAIEGGALNFHNTVNVCLGTAKNSKANPLGGKQNVLDLVADLFANKDLGTFGQGNLTDGLRLVKTFANHYQLFGKLVKNADKDLADVTDSDVKFFYEVLDDLSKGLKAALSQFFKATFKIFYPNQANNQEDDLISNDNLISNDLIPDNLSNSNPLLKKATEPNTSSSDTIDLIAANVDDLAAAACTAQLEQTIDSVAQNNVAIFGNMVAKNILPGDKQEDMDQYQQIDNAKQNYQDVKNVFDASQGGYEFFAQKLLQKYVNEISGDHADAGAKTDCRLIIANAIRTSKQLTPPDTSEQQPPLEGTNDEPILIQTEDTKDKNKEGMNELLEVPINIQINTHQEVSEDDINTISTTRRNQQEQKAGAKQKVIQYEGFLKGLGPSIVKLLQAVSTEKVKASDQKNPGNVAKYGSLETALRGLKDDLPQISQDVIEAELNNVINTHNAKFANGQTTKQEGDKTIRKIESIKVEGALGCASVGEAVKAKINYVTGDSEDVVIKFIRPEVENRFKREREILTTLLDPSSKDNDVLQSHLQNWNDRLATCKQELDLNTEGANIEQGNRNYDEANNRDALFKTTKVALKTGSQTCLIMSYDGDKTLSQECASARELVAQEKEINEKISSRIPKPMNPDAPTLGELKEQHRLRGNALGGVPGGPQFKEDVENKVQHLRKASKALKKLSQKWMTTAFGENSFYHADLHSGNILIDQDNKLTLIDFGNVGKTNDQNKNAQKKVSKLLSKLMAMCSPDHKVTGYQEAYETLTKNTFNYAACSNQGIDYVANFKGIIGFDVNAVFSGRIDPELPDVFLTGYLDLMADGDGKRRLTDEMNHPTAGVLLRTMLYKIFETRGSAFEKFTLAISFMQSKDYPIPADLFNFLEAGQRLRNSVAEVQEALKDLKAICVKYQIKPELEKKPTAPNERVQRERLTEDNCKDIDFGDDWSFEKEITDGLPKNQVDDEESDQEDDGGPVDDAKKASAMVKIMAGKYYYDHKGIESNKCDLPKIEEGMTKLVLSEMLQHYKWKENYTVFTDYRRATLVKTGHQNKDPVTLEDVKTFQGLSTLIRERKISKWGKGISISSKMEDTPLTQYDWEWWDSSSCWFNATAPLKYDDYALTLEKNLKHRKNHTAAIKGLKTELEKCKTYKTEIFPKQPEAETLYQNQQTGRHVQFLKNYCKMRANSFKSLAKEENDNEKDKAIREWKAFDEKVFTTINAEDIKRSVVGQNGQAGTDQAALKLGEGTEAEKKFRNTKKTRYNINPGAVLSDVIESITTKLKGIPSTLEAISNKVTTGGGLTEADSETLENLAGYLDGLDERYRNMYGVKSEVYQLI